jgi:hypothetical protein
MEGEEVSIQRNHAVEGEAVEVQGICRCKAVRGCAGAAVIHFSVKEIVFMVCIKVSVFFLEQVIKRMPDQIPSNVGNAFDDVLCKFVAEEKFGCIWNGKRKFHVEKEWKTEKTAGVCVKTGDVERNEKSQYRLALVSWPEENIWRHECDFHMDFGSEKDMHILANLVL